MTAKSMGERLGEQLSAQKLSQNALARKAGVRQQTIQYLISSKANGSSYAVRLARALGVNPVWLQEGTGDPLSPAVSVTPYPGMAAAHWIHKLQSLSEVDAMLIGEGLSGPMVVTAAEVGDRAFAVDVVGRSMAPDFQDGDELVADPERKPEPGDFVLAAVGGTLTLRRWRPQTHDGSLYSLVASNADYPAVESDKQQCRIIATVVEHRRKLVDRR
jgi:SOS-response transcriptional repressor LexA